MSERLNRTPSHHRVIGSTNIITLGDNSFFTSSFEIFLPHSSKTSVVLNYPDANAIFPKTLTKNEIALFLGDFREIFGKVEKHHHSQYIPIYNGFRDNTPKIITISQYFPKSRFSQKQHFQISLCHRANPSILKRANSFILNRMNSYDYSHFLKAQK